MIKYEWKWRWFKFWLITFMSLIRFNACEQNMRSTQLKLMCENNFSNRAKKYLLWIKKSLSFGAYKEVKVGNSCFPHTDLTRKPRSSHKMNEVRASFMRPRIHMFYWSALHMVCSVNINISSYNRIFRIFLEIRINRIEKDSEHVHMHVPTPWDHLFIRDLFVYFIMCRIEKPHCTENTFRIACMHLFVSTMVWRWFIVIEIFNRLEMRLQQLVR